MAFTGVNDEGKRLYEELKQKHTYRYIIYRLSGREVVVEKAAPASATYEQFLADLPNPDDCRWIVYDLEIAQANGQKHSKITFIIWAPDRASIRQKMQYSAWNQVVTKNLEGGGISNIVQATDRSEIDYNTVLEKVTRRMLSA